MSHQEANHEFCKRLPKIELHAHLNGSIREETLVELARERGVELPPEFHDGFHTNRDPSQFLNSKPRSLVDCFHIFSFIPKCVSDVAALERITREALEDAADENICYIELRTGPKILFHHEGEVCTKEDYLGTIIRVMESFERRELNRYEAIDRRIKSKTVEEAYENVDLAIELKASGCKQIVGVELGGDPTKNDFGEHFLPVFSKARRHGLPISIHCGEVPMARESRDRPDLVRAHEEALSILKFGPERLGHSLLISEDLGVMLDDLLIPVEVCPTSNVLTLELANHEEGCLLKGIQNHPQLRKWLDSKYPISLNTDDAGIFATTLTREYALVAKAFHLSKIDLSNMLIDSVETIFDPGKEKLKQAITTRVNMMLGP
ncbi:hypothetical protein THAOC_29146 [Thalassiosira oceanica]|uniref:Adenosine deaminase domain-containing protein n=1 Tax=Thalassiosira oceanica TaxID=159749 RepID=K0RYE7_THAOC|nr:hypothetical protein THAOC_29146 [Thalassiosira oceanica]|eukprot:EJK51662.1 hypothetical protein THAOC_29146 [Thalassiosira oceanica]